MTRSGDWIQVHSGRQFWPRDPDPADVDIRDIAHALSLVCRFTGHVRSFYSVAQHSVLVAKAVGDATGCRRTAMAGLLHDASEAYLADVARPVKHLPEMAGYRAAEARLEAVIAERFGLAYPWHEAVKAADCQALATERRDLMVVQRDDWGWLPEPWPQTITSWAPDHAERSFLAMFQACGGKL